MTQAQHTSMALDRIKWLAEGAKNGFRSHQAKEAIREIIRLRLVVHHYYNIDRENLRRMRTAARSVVQSATPDDNGYARVHRRALQKLAAQVGTDLNGGSEE
jgi:hypothetical protein